MIFKQAVKQYTVGWTVRLGNVPKVRYFDDRAKAYKFWQAKKAWENITIKDVWMST